MSKRITSSGAHLRSLSQGNTALKQAVQLAINKKMKNNYGNLLKKKMTYLLKNIRKCPRKIKQRAKKRSSRPQKSNFPRQIKLRAKKGHFSTQKHVKSKKGYHAR